MDVFHVDIFPVCKLFKLKNKGSKYMHAHKDTHFHTITVNDLLYPRWAMLMEALCLINTVGNVI